MDNDNQLGLYCEDDRDYRVYYEVCDNLCIQRFSENHLKSRTHTNNIHKRQQLKKSIQIISQY